MNVSRTPANAVSVSQRLVQAGRGPASELAFRKGSWTLVEVLHPHLCDLRTCLRAGRDPAMEEATPKAREGRQRICKRS